MPEDRRLIDVAFPLKQASLDSVHEKSVRHGHISTLHVWPARRPLAASRAALIAALLPDPGTPSARKQILERMGGRVVEKIERKRVGGRNVEKVKEETVGGILRWKREDDPDLDWFCQKIREAYNGRIPRVLDPFAGGGAIPLEAMRLGCEVVASDINPVAWFVLKCTLEYPQKLAGQTRPLPEFALEDREFMEAFLKAKGFKGASLRTFLERLGHGYGGEIQLDALPHDDPTLKADLAWHVRAWSRWVLAKARKELAPYYPTYAEFEPLKPGKDYEPRPMRLMKVDENGIPQIDPLNAEFDNAYLKAPQKPRWVAKPTVAYLWARTVRCKNCRAMVPLLKTRWVCKKDNKRVVLMMELNADRTGVDFGVLTDVPQNGSNAAQRREHDRRIGTGTMSRSGVTCPCCGTISTMEDLRLEGKVGKLGVTMTAVVVDGPHSKEYRTPTGEELEAVSQVEAEIQHIFSNLPFGAPEEPINTGSIRKGGVSITRWGVESWRDIFLNRQLFSIGLFLQLSRAVGAEMRANGYPEEWIEACRSSLTLMLDRLANQSSTLCRWNNRGEKIEGTFSRFALPIVWDFSEVNPLSETTGGYSSAVNWVGLAIDYLIRTTKAAPTPSIALHDATHITDGLFDLIITDPPYYDAIPYADLMDFFYVWIRRSMWGLGPIFDEAFQSATVRRWDPDLNEGELIDDESRFDGNRDASKQAYEEGMFQAFRASACCLQEDGRFVVVFANKHPIAWETLVSALIRAGLVVDASWPIQTEMQTRTRALVGAALASSVWLVCRKRSAAGRPGWDTSVLKEMHENITKKLRDFWDAGIRGPDFVWAATGPALEAFSKYPVVKKANDPNQLMTVSEFLRDVRRMVVDFVVGRVLTRNSGDEALTGLDDVTTYYLLHRHDFGMDEAPIGASILYALSCNLSDSALVNQFDLLGQSCKSGSSAEEYEEETAEDTSEDEGGGSGAKVKLKVWNRRRGRNLGLEAPGGRPVPLIDQVHKLMHLWRTGDQVRVDDYLDSRGLNRNALFNQILQALIELAASGSDERSLLESLSNHVAARGGTSTPRQGQLV